ncbi:MAG: Pls/PosA family non-ribosomal peptide synthetase [Geminicoccales bacterium]
MEDLDRKTSEMISADVETEAFHQPITKTPRDLSDLVLMPEGNNEVRWTQGERLHHLFEQRVDELPTSHLAIDSDEGQLTFAELDQAANRLARHMLSQGLGSGDIVALLFDRSNHSYVSLLAVQKINAAYVPLDVGFPEDRINYICEDAGVSTIMTLDRHAEKLEGLDISMLCLDSAGDRIAAQDSSRLSFEETGHPVSELSYIIYTSGTTGRPKGVPIEQGSICNFVRVAAETYGYGPEDRVYQGLTIAFDFSVEEIWVPLLAGGTLVPNQTGRSLLGSDLHAFLADNDVTAMCCVPTLLSTIEDDLPKLRLLITSGEACPHDLVKRWYQDGRTILNAYGPTETTVTATITEMVPEKPVTIGAPLPTYSVAILDPDQSRALPKGEVGEIAIGGICLATGYLGREDLTNKVFISDFLNIPNNPSKRLYRSGDLGRINEDGEIEYLGRIDLQVKIRGYRIELTEIESVIMQLPGIAQAVVDTFEPMPGAKELVAYYSPVSGSDHMPAEEISKALAEMMPAYMVPAFYEPLAVIPMTSNDKADRKALPKPSGLRHSSSTKDHVEPQGDIEQGLARLLAELLGIERVSAEDHFFDDLGTNSLLMARYSAKIRKELGINDVSMRDIYASPTVRAMAALLEAKPKAEKPKGNQEKFRIPSKFEYYGCGALQLLFWGANIALGLGLMIVSMNWIFSATGMWDIYFRSVTLGMGLFVLALLVPFAAKWGMEGRWKEERFPIWSLRYFRFWVVRQYIQVNPMAAFAGTPIYNMYLRLLGAKIGKNVVIMSKSGPVCTDLIEIGDDTILTRETIMKGYRAENGYIQTGRISIGSNCYVGEASVVEINSVMQDDTQLAHASSLQAGQVIPSGKRYHGSPAEEASTDFDRVEPKSCSTLRKVIYCTYLVYGMFLLLPPLGTMALMHFLPFLFAEGDAIARFSSLIGDFWHLIALALPVLSLTFFIMAIPAGLIWVAIWPRVANFFMKEDKVYVRYGLHYIIFQMIHGMSNIKFFNDMFGDTVYITRYMKWIGWDLSTVIQTGSNFGTAQKHDNPLLCKIGTGTMVSDGLQMLNANMSTSSFKVSTCELGDNNYLGNAIFYPAESRTGDNCLLGTKVMIPVDGPVRENTGLLGSPAFEIPRMSQRDQEMSTIDEDERALGIQKKTAHNVRTIGLWLLGKWLFSLIMAYLGLASLLLYNDFGVWSLVGGMVIGFALTIGYFIGLEWLSLGFKRLQPLVSTLYDKRFWGVERHWKVADTPLTKMFFGTPFRPMIHRALGVKVGKRVFDDGCMVTEKTLIEIGDFCTLNEESTLQPHSLEEGVFKMDNIKVGNGVTLGINAFAHYGVNVGDNAILAADCFLMKGETVGSDEVWMGNPAKAV